MFYLFGMPALSHFRIERILTQISFIVPQVTDLSAYFIHFIDIEKNTSLTEPENEILSNLLDYGYSQGKPAFSLETEKPPDSFLVLPRKGTISPWSSKATDILHLCNLKKIRRIERGIAYYLEATDKLTWGDTQAIAELLYDPMTEMILYNIEEASCLFEHEKPKPLKIIPLLTEGKRALMEANLSFGLDLGEEEFEYLFTLFNTLKRNPTDAELMMFAEINSEHCRHKLFNAQWLMDGKLKTASLFSMIKNTFEQHSRGIFSAYEDNAAIMQGGPGFIFSPNLSTHHYEMQEEDIHCVFKQETSNYPTSISPYTGSQTAVGGEIRDEAASGRGATSKAGVVGLCVSNLEIPGFMQPWETVENKPKVQASPLDIILKAPGGSAQFANEFGRPTLCGFFRSFEDPNLTEKNTTWGYRKPIMIAGGVGNIRPMQIEKGPLQKDMWVLLIGGPSMLIGLGGGLASSVVRGTEEENLDFAAVQRGNAEMQRRCQEVINACTAMGKQNPIVCIHDVGAGGLANALPELLYRFKVGGIFELRAIPTADDSLSPMEIWCNESQERFIIILKPEAYECFEKIAQREACPYALIGKLISEPTIICHDALDNSFPVNIRTDLLFDKTPRVRQHADHLSQTAHLSPFQWKDIPITDAGFRLLKLPAIADKSFLISILDRSVTGLVCRDAFVGPWQVPVADCGVTCRDFQGFQGEAMSMGERPLLSLISPAASARMSVGEAITNMAAACVSVLSDVRLSANWMAASGYSDEAARLYDAVQAIGMELCPALNLCIPTGKDSLAMQTVWQEDDVIKRVVSPVSVVITGFAPVRDVRRTLTPLLCSDCGETQLIYIDLSGGHQRLGGSAFAQTYGAMGNDCPDVSDPNLLKSFFISIQQLNLENKILAYHDRSDGGLFITLCEMAFASHTGLQIELTALGKDPHAILFNEELGVVVQVRSEDLDAILLQLNDFGLVDCHSIGTLDESDQITFVHNEEVIFKEERVTLQRAWSETSFHLQSLRDNPRTAKKQFEMLNDKTDPGLNAILTFELSDEMSTPSINVGAKPVVGILREQGINGHVEMAAAFHKAGFTALDLHMNDLQTGRVHLSSLSGLAVCAGFSFGDALGAGLGWAKRILYNDNLKEQFSDFFKREDNFTLGISNGCQMLAGLKSIIPGTDSWPDFLRNHSEQFECRLCLVEVETSVSPLFQGMEGSRIPVVIAHGEGRAEFKNEIQQEEAINQKLITLRYVDTRGRTTYIYPANPNGSTLGITGLTTPNGRINIMMTHPERGFRTVQYSWHPKEWGEDGPWLQLFRNARLLV